MRKKKTKPLKSGATLLKAKRAEDLERKKKRAEATFRKNMEADRKAKAEKELYDLKKQRVILNGTATALEIENRGLRELVHSMSKQLADYRINAAIACAKNPLTSGEWSIAAGPDEAPKAFVPMSVGFVDRVSDTDTSEVYKP